MRRVFRTILPASIKRHERGVVYTDTADCGWTAAAL